MFAVLILVHLTIIALAEPIVEAAKNGDLLAVKTILANDPSKLNATDENKYTALHWAGMRAHWDVAEFLIEKGAKLNIWNEDSKVHHAQLSFISC